MHSYLVKGSAQLNKFLIVPLRCKKGLGGEEEVS